MRRSVLHILDLDSHDGLREGSGLVSLFGREEVGGQGGVKGICQQHKLELDLELEGTHNDNVGIHADSGK